LPRLTAGEQVVQDYREISLTLRQHPLALLRSQMKALGIVQARDLATLPEIAQPNWRASFSSGGAPEWLPASSSPPSRTKPASATSLSGPRSFSGTAGRP